MTSEVLDKFTRSMSRDDLPDFFKRLSQHINEPSTTGSLFELGVNMTSSDKISFKLMVTGCQGEGNSEQRTVANAMNKKLQDLSSKKAAGLLLGDNFYDSGVDTKFDSKFDELFKNIYSQKHNWFAALGNHDWNFQNTVKAWWGASAPHHKKAMAQVDHTYCSNDGTIMVDTWVMPHRYYVVETNWANIIVLDSNTLCFDPQQQSWFKKVLTLANEKTPTRQNVIAMHHPLMSVGKRNAFGNAKDVHQYILPEYHYTGPRDTSLNHLLFTLFCDIKKELNDAFNISLILCAHDHFLAESYIGGLDCKQLTIGGGGGPLQEVRIEKVCDFFAKQHGFVELDFNQSEINYSFFDSNSRPLYKNLCNNATPLTWHTPPLSPRRCSPVTI